MKPTEGFGAHRRECSMHRESKHTGRDEAYKGS